MRQAGQAIREAIPTRVLAESLGVRINRQGEALCPFHGDTNKSLKVYKDPARGWACFGCHRGGTVIDFAMQWYGIDFRQAVIRLDADFGLGLPIGRKQTAQERSATRRQRREQAEAQRKAYGAFYTAEIAFWAASDLLCECLSATEENRPKKPSEAFSDKWAEAVKKLPEKRDDFERARDALEIARKEVEKLGGTAKSGSTACAMDQGRLPKQRCSL